MPAASFTITDNPSYLYWDHTPLDLKSEIIPWLGVSSFSWLVDLLLSLFHLLPLFCLMKDILAKAD